MPSKERDTEWIDQYKQEAYRLPNGELNPAVYTFIFDVVNDRGDFFMLRMPDSPEWPYSPFLYGEYDPFGKNEHLGQRIPRLERMKALGGVILDRLEIRLGY